MHNAAVPDNMKGDNTSRSSQEDCDALFRKFFEIALNEEPSTVIAASLFLAATWSAFFIALKNETKIDDLFKMFMECIEKKFAAEKPSPTVPDKSSSIQ